VVVDAPIDLLLGSREPAVARLARRDLLGEGVGDDAFYGGSIVEGLLDFDFDAHPYKKWQGSHWRLVSLVELGIPPGDERALAGADHVLDGWLTTQGHRKRIPTIDGLTRRCGSQEGNALAVCCRLGMAGDPRVQLLAESLVGWQWPDGGWNCDRKATGYRSSFNESLPPMWGLHEYFLATGDTAARDAAGRTAELFLEHRIFLSLKTGEPIHKNWVVPHYPPFWHYDAPQALLILSRMGLAGDERARDAVEVLVERRRPDGSWRAGPAWWGRPGRRGSNVEAVDWGEVAHQMVTLNALQILASVQL
jgi:hypothetical protein